MWCFKFRFELNLSFTPTSIIFNPTIRLSSNFFQKFSEIFFYLRLKFQDDQSLVMLFDKWSNLLSIFFYVFRNDIHSGLPLIKDAINNSMVRLDGNIKEQVMKAFLNKVQHVLRERMRSMHSKQTKDEKGLSSNQEIGFGCIHKKSFLGHRKSKLMFRGDGSLRFLERVNAYKMDLQDEYNVIDIFKVFFCLM